MKSRVARQGRLLTSLLRCLLTALLALAAALTIVAPPQAAAAATSASTIPAVYNYDGVHQLSQVIRVPAAIPSLARAVCSQRPAAVAAQARPETAPRFAAEEIAPAVGKPIFRGVPRYTRTGEPNPAFDDALQGIARPRG